MSELTEQQQRYESHRLKMMPLSELVFIARYLSGLTPEQRIDALEFIQESTSFCWSCGSDLGERERCHCENDA